MPGSWQPSPYLNPPLFGNGDPLETVLNMDILGIAYNSRGTGVDHVTKKVNNCRRIYFGYNNVGLCYPGLQTDAKVGYTYGLLFADQY